MVFSDKKELLALYNAINKTHYEDPEQLEINQLTIILAKQNRTEDIIKAANDPEYQRKLLEEFSL